MCVLIYCESRKVSEKEFKNCFDVNSDGFGMAWREGEKIFFKKGMMKLEDAWKFYNEYKFPNGHVLHFRKKSTGSISPELTHPFIVSETSEPLLEGAFLVDKKNHGLLFQNGTLKDWENYLMSYMIASGKSIKNELSDTRAMAVIISRTGQHLLSHLPGKFLFFDKKYAYIYGDFEKVDGVFFSNDSYKDIVPYVAPKSTYQELWSREDYGYGKSKYNSSVKTKTFELPWYDIANYKF
jgi:hypothetical protein